MYKNKWLLILVVVIMAVIGTFVMTSCNKNTTDDPIIDDIVDPVELEVPVEDIQSIALKEGSISAIYKIGDALDLTNAELLITLKPDEEEELEEGEEPVLVVVPVKITEEMIEDFATAEVGFATMRIVYAPEFEVSHDYEVIAYTVFFITYNLDEGEFAPLYDDEENLIEIPLRFDSLEGLEELREPQKAYYEFDGWYTDIEFEASKLVTSLATGLNNDVALYAKWKPLEYTITFVTDYVNCPTITYTVKSGIIALPEINTEGVEQGDYDKDPKSQAFAGWYDNPAFPTNAKKVTHNADSPRDIVLYAKWEDKMSISLNDGFESRYQQGAAVSAVKTAFLTVKDYNGVVVNPKVTVASAMITNFVSTEIGVFDLTITYKGSGTIDYTIKVQYEIVPNTVYNITYILNGGELPLDAPDSFDSTDGVSEFVVPTKTGYDFIGWCSDSALKRPIASIAVGVKAHQTIYASFLPTVYTVKYYTNSEDLFEQEDTYKITETTNLWLGATREGYHFMGWYDNANHEGEAQEGIEIGNYGNKEFFAKWGAKVTKVTITSEKEYNVKDEFLQLTAEVLPDGEDPAVYPQVTYKVISEIYQGTTYATGVQVTNINGELIINEGKFVAEKAGYVIVQAFADGIASEKVAIKVVVEDVEEINILNDPLVVFPGGIVTQIVLGFEPFTAKPNTTIDYSEINFDVRRVETPGMDHAADYIFITEDGKITIQEGISNQQEFAFTVRVTYGKGSKAVYKDATFNVPKVIQSVEDLMNVRNNLKGYYVLGADIDLSVLEDSWEPIGYVLQVGEELNYNNAFSGMFFGGKNSQGKPYVIKNLTINAEDVPYIAAGLFGAINKSHIEGIVLQNLTIIGECTQDTKYIGGIAGVNRLSVVKDCTVTGTINIVGGRYIGGMIGQQYGSMKDVKTYFTNEQEEEEVLDISVESAEANLSVGGLVGLFLNGTIDNADIKGTITVMECNSAKVGGIVGDSRDRIVNSAVGMTMSITGKEGATGTTLYVGGVAGNIIQSIHNIVVDADIDIDAKAIIFVGGISGAGVNVYDAVSTLSINIVNSTDVKAGGVSGNISGTLDIADVTLEGVSISATTVRFGGLVGVSSGVVEGDVLSNEDIDVTAPTVYFGGIIGETTAVAQGTFHTENNVDITATTTIFAGGVVGSSTNNVKGSVIASDFSLVAPTVNFGGIVGKTTANAEGTTQYEEVVIEASKEAFVGGIAGYAANITNSSADLALLKVVGDAYIGGIAGQVTHTVTDCFASGIIENIIGIKIKLGNIGGIVGRIGSSVLAVVDNCSSDIQISAESKLDGNYSIGGIVGYATADITNSTSTGAISALSSKNEALIGGATIYVGGVVGQTNYAKVGQVFVGLVENCSAEIVIDDIRAVGNALGTVYAGGLVGLNRGEISKSFAKSQITAFALKDLYVGGLVGSNEAATNSPATITNTYAITGVLKIDMSESGDKGYLGGLVGRNTGVVSNSYAKAILDGSAKGRTRELYIGGFVGNNTATIEESFALNAVSTSVQAVVLDDATIYAGGFVGGNMGTANNKLAVIKNAYTTVNVAADAYTGGFVGINNGFGTISYAISRGEVNKNIEGTMVGGFAAEGLIGYSRCYYSTTHTGDKQKVGAGDVDDTMIQGMSDYNLRNKFSYEAANYDNTIWNIDGNSIPTLIFDNEIWVEGENGLELRD